MADGFPFFGPPLFRWPRGQGLSASCRGAACWGGAPPHGVRPNHGFAPSGGRLEMDLVAAETARGEIANAHARR